MRALERLRIAHGASAAGDALIAVALAGTLFFDVPVGQARAKVALYLVLTMAPFAVLSALIGPALDHRRGGARAGMIVAAAGRALLALFMAGAFGSLLLYPYAFGVLVLSRAHTLGRSALTPTLTGDEPLVSVNARLTRTALLAATAVGAAGAALARISPGGTLLAAAAAFGLAGTASVTLPRGEPGAEPRATTDHAKTPLPPRAQGAFVVNAWMRALGAFLLFLLAFALRARGYGGAATGLVLAAAGAGAFAGSAIFPRFKQIPAEERVLMVGLVLGAATCLVAFRTFSYPVAITMAVIVGATGSAARIAYDAVLQSEVDQANRGRAFARAETRLQLAWVGGAAVPTLIPLPLGLGFLIGASGFAAAALWYLAARRQAA